MKWVIKITNDINILREKIDSIDKEIIKLILKRMEIVHQVGVTKSKDNSRIYVPEREIAIYKKLSVLSGISNKDISNFYTEIISFCRKLEGILDVAIKKDSYSLLGVKKLFGEHVNSIFVESFEDINTDIKYILAPFNKEILDFIQKKGWSVINRAHINNETLYLFSSFENKIFKDNDIAMILESTKLSDDFIEINNETFISLIPYENIELFSDSTILGVIPNN
ncbi:MAG: chorismate mutase [Cetobacterium sp.]|uniref:chorismate mutase n=1 Tax=unclassified Cetobacterium TaxID=2630983 RepID=UPI000648C2F5|nr:MULTISPECIES: chorismate mutase [unclassified Cetobacterium]